LLATTPVVRRKQTQEPVSGLYSQRLSPSQNPTGRRARL